jgi:HEAT repeat protein
VTAELIRILEGGDATAARVAAVALGTPGNVAATAPLARALESDDARLRMAAIRGLGRIATPAAREILESAAASHPDAETRRRARAEASLLMRGVPSATAPAQ